MSIFKLCYEVSRDIEVILNVGMFIIKVKASGSDKRLRYFYIFEIPKNKLYKVLNKHLVI